ncbi:MAG: ATP-binding cassette domain-containing protein [Acidobacteria bacterium]|nr:ATP-binding cassette domain-containing protein [Acidobacteriota bacterium]
MEHPLVLEIQKLSHWFGDNLVLHNLDLNIIRGEIVSLVGPSGCGKSTLLRAIVGTHPPCRGQVAVYALGATTPTVVVNPSRDRGIVYQQYSLFPFLTAAQNVAMGLMLDQTSLPFRFFRHMSWRNLRRRHLEEAEALLEKLKLANAIRLYPHEMSGGMCQRVAIAQALIMKPEILLLDEPFGALDEATREELQRMLLTLYQENIDARAKGEDSPYTIMIVTHELNEAIYVGDRVVALSQFWNWQEQGHLRCPGATIVLDQPVPVYHPDEERNFETFIQVRRRIRQAAFESSVLQDPREYKTFAADLASGRGEGVLR